MTDKTIALLRSLFATDENGKTYLRVITATPEGDLTNAVSRQSNRSLETLLSNAIVLDSDGNPAINLAVVEYGESVQSADNRRREAMVSEREARERRQAEARKTAAKAANT